MPKYEDCARTQHFLSTSYESRNSWLLAAFSFSNIFPLRTMNKIIFKFFVCWLLFYFSFNITELKLLSFFFFSSFQLFISVSWMKELKRKKYVKRNYLQKFLYVYLFTIPVASYFILYSMQLNILQWRNFS